MARTCAGRSALAAPQLGGGTIVRRPRIHSDPQTEIRPDRRGLAVRGGLAAALTAASRRPRADFRAPRGGARNASRITASGAMISRVDCRRAGR